VIPDARSSADDDAGQTLSDAAVDQLLAPISVIKGQAQLLRRWVRRSDLAGGQAALARLEVIETMVAVLAADLNVRRRPPPAPHQPETDRQDMP